MDYYQRALAMLDAPQVHSLEQEAALLAAFKRLVDGYDYGLWGQCGTKPGWRAQVLSVMLKRNPRIRIYNPDKGLEQWREHHNYEEEVARRFVLADFFYIGPEARSTVSLIEAAAHAFYRNSHFVIFPTEPGTEILGQTVTEKQANVLNKMRLIVRQVARINRRPVYETLYQAGTMMPLYRPKLEARRTNSVSDSIKVKIQGVLAETEYAPWLEASEIRISSDPFDAQIETLVALLVAYCRLEADGALWIHLPQTDAWRGAVSHGETIEGRLHDDLRRTVQPYLKRLISLAPSEAYTVEPE